MYSATTVKFVFLLINLCAVQSVTVKNYIAVTEKCSNVTTMTPSIQRTSANSELECAWLCSRNSWCLSFRQGRPVSWDRNSGECTLYSYQEICIIEDSLNLDTFKLTTYPQEFSVESAVVIRDTHVLLMSRLGCRLVSVTSSGIQKIGKVHIGWGDVFVGMKAAPTSSFYLPVDQSTTALYFVDGAHVRVYHIKTNLPADQLVFSTRHVIITMYKITDFFYTGGLPLNTDLKFDATGTSINVTGGGVKVYSILSSKNTTLCTWTSRSPTGVGPPFSPEECTEENLPVFGLAPGTALTAYAKILDTQLWIHGSNFTITAVDENIVHFRGFLEFNN